jgi:pimeloyl-ACP methyl ester carboxylesterase
MTDAAAVARPSSPYYTEPSRLLVGDLDVAYRRAGEGEPVLFLHGAGSTRMWLPFYERLSQSVDLIAPEHPGFGDTAFPDWLDGFDDVTLHYRDFLELLSLDRVHLVGFSLGGWMAAELAIFYPERLKSLTLITPAGLHLPEAPRVNLFAMPPEAIPGLLFNDDFMPYVDFLPNPESLDDIVHAYGELGTFSRLTWTPSYDPKFERRLPRIQVPTLVVGAEDDRIIPNAHTDRFAELLPNSRLERIAGTGHGLIMQEPDRTAEVILSFIEGVNR